MEANCPMCSENYNLSTRIPRITLVCGHSFCPQCLSTLIQNPNMAKCPLDQSPFPFHMEIDKFPINFALKEVLESIMSNESCSLHEQEFVSFCLTDKCKICVVCWENEHAGHKIRTFKSIKNRTADYQKQLVDRQKNLKETGNQMKQITHEKDILMQQTETSYSILTESCLQKTESEGSSLHKI